MVPPASISLFGHVPADGQAGAHAPHWPVLEPRKRPELILMQLLLLCLAQREDLGRAPVAGSHPSGAVRSRKEADRLQLLGG